MVNNISKEMLLEYTKVCYLYYKTGLKQEAVAKRMNMSRQRVNRILRDSLDLGIVQINIFDDGSNLATEVALEEKYHLKHCSVVNNYDIKSIHDDLGEGAAKYLKSILKDGDTIGFSRGRSISSLVEKMPIMHNLSITVTQLLGSDNNGGEKKNKDSDSIVYRFCEKTNGTAKPLHVPIIVQTKELKESLIRDPFFIDSYATVKNCDIAVFGIGNENSQTKHIASLYNDEFTENDNRWKKGLVGEVCARYYDKNGKHVETPFENRIITVQLEDLFKIPTRIGVAGSKEKASAIKAALLGGFMNVLIVDKETAELLLE